MKCRLFALTLALGALLCFAPSAAALDAQPEAPAPEAAAEVQEEADAVSSTEVPAGEEEAPMEVPILPENPPTMISYTTPEEIGFVWEDSIEPEQPESQPAAEAAAPAQADSAVSPAPEANDGTAAGTGSDAAILPQTGTTGFLSGMLAGSGSVMTFLGWFFTHRQHAFLP